jgi:YfiR/HmsC-like
MVNRNISSCCAALAAFGIGSKRAIRILCTILAIIAAGIYWPDAISVSAELSRPAEYELKAAFLYNFIKFTEWPAQALGKQEEPFVIGVLGKDPFGAALDKLIEGETVQNKTIVARRFPRMDEAAANSHVLFISSSEESHLPAILRLVDRQGILSVSEIENFAQRGGMINLKKENNKIVFEINIEAAKRAGLTMNAQLLKLAKIVKGIS